jgi:DNA-binding response OmpR family regulator
LLIQSPIRFFFSKKDCNFKLVLLLNNKKHLAALTSCLYFTMQAKSQIKVLIVDDEPNILTALEFLLKKEGYQVSKALNGRAALDMMASLTPDILILDVMMPEMDGFEVAGIVRATPKFEQTRIIFLTAKGTQADRFVGYSKGAEVYLTKPFDNTELISTINEVVEFG